MLARKSNNNVIDVALPAVVERALYRGSRGALTVRYQISENIKYILAVVKYSSSIDFLYRLA